MHSFKFVWLVILLLTILGCTTTTGMIQDNRFSVEQDFSVALLDSDWQVGRQTVFRDGIITRQNTQWPISFSHKNSNGFVGVRSFQMNEVGQARSLEVWADNMVANSGGLKLSQKSVKIDGNEAIELVISGTYMAKQIFLKKGDKGFFIVYSNSPAYFDQYLDVFDKFVETVRIFYSGKGA